VFERIVIAVDGSPRSERTIPVGVDLAQRYGAEVSVVHVREYERYEGDDVDLGPPIPRRSARGARRLHVPRSRAELRPAPCGA
jgi:nucleotide-binding universal stress UspA family protein